MVAREYPKVIVHSNQFYVNYAYNLELIYEYRSKSVGTW